MKKYFVTVTILLCTLAATAQIKEGTIVYERKIDMHKRIQDEQMKAMIRAVLRSTELILKNETEVVAYIQKDFGLDQKVAVDSYKILLKVLNSDGDIDDTTLKTIIDKIRQESGLTAEIPSDRLVDLTLLREVKAELRKK